MNLITADNKIVHGLWIGTKLSKVELLTLRSFIFHGHEFHLWVYDELETIVPEGVILKDATTVMPREKIFRYNYTNQFGHGKGSLGGFSDVFRYKLLYDHGGWWVDMDVTCLKPLNFNEEYVFRPHHDLDIVGNVMKCPQGSLLMKQCYDQASVEVDENNRDWHKPITILNKHIKELQLDSYIRELSNPDSWNYIRKLLFRKVTFPDHWYAIHWVNEEWKRNRINKEEFLKRSEIHKLMDKYGVQSERIAFWQGAWTRTKLAWLCAVQKQGPWLFRRIISYFMGHTKWWLRRFGLMKKTQYYN